MPATDGLPSSNRALVAVAPQQIRVHYARTPRPAAFLAHLIATAHKLPQTRQRCRAEPGEAIAAYQAALKSSGQ